MHARITTLRTTAAQHDEGARIIVEELVPWAQNASGYCGLLRLDSRETETTLVVTLWSTLGALEQSGEAIARMATLAAEASGAELVSVDHYDLTLVDLPPSWTPSSSPPFAWPWAYLLDRPGPPLRPSSPSAAGPVRASDPDRRSL